VSLFSITNNTARADQLTTATAVCARRRGLCTVCWGIFVMLWLPDSPVKSARYFTDRERTILVERVRENDTGIQGRKWRWDVSLSQCRTPCQPAA
jgi:hypothetical protein